MKTGTKLTGYGLALAVVFGGAWAIGAGVGPLQTEPPPMAAMAPDMPSTGMPGMEEHGGHEGGATDVLPGLASASNGYRLETPTTTLASGMTKQFTFRIVDDHGTAITKFALKHEKRLHLVLVRRDGAGFQHVHPTMAADGTWRIPLKLTAPGSYRLFTDFVPEGGEATVLGTELQVPGTFQPRPDGPEVTSTTVDGYRVTINGHLEAGKEAELTATITRGGHPVTDLQTYLGAYGHLVVLRATDLGYLHVHPQESTTAGPEVKFMTEVPTPGRYRLYLDFQHHGTVHTAQFTVDSSEEAHR
ncbi:hypothetical protein [Labedaea rhizosphaerae]|uniref:Secreted protein n=1 Tax=Labedaea rhizosphaerae TaxID=598644 RepID=A0A4R6SGT1_LABRH|nr:hypothetical protein [Labedaea rhizosphaerae]TDQ00944.1 hypothetical protein EV186_102810 [Labedaea rhizosphaerae]